MHLLGCYRSKRTQTRLSCKARRPHANTLHTRWTSHPATFPVQTPWEGGQYTLRLEFADDFPASPPAAYFDPVPPHINIFSSGFVCLSFLKEEHWVPSMDIPAVLQGIADLLNSPNPHSVANEAAWRVFTTNRAAHDDAIRRYAAAHPPKDV